MIPEAREVHLSRKDRKVLEACCRSPMTIQRDLKRARIVLLAAAGRSTRSIAKEVGVQPRIVSLWRHRYADHGLEGLRDKPRPGKQPIYTKATDKRILKLLEKPPPEGFARWTGPLLAGALGDVDVQYVWRFLRSHKIDKRRLCFGVEGTPDKDPQWLPSSQGDGDTEVERRVPYDLSRRQNTTHGKRCGAARNGQSGRIASGLHVCRLQRRQ
jgi:transposase